MWLKFIQLNKQFIPGIFKRSFLLVVFFSLLFAPVEASALFDSSISDANLISSVEGVGSQNVVWVGLDIHLKPGWKTYWRSPGATGYGLKIDWSGSKNLKSAEIYWPAPSKFETFKMVAQGYKDHVLLPIQVALDKKNTPLVLKAKLDYLAFHSH